MGSINNMGAWVRRIIMMAALATSGAAWSADYVIYNQGAGTAGGLDNTALAAPVARNSGTTLGQQRRIALRYAIEQVLGRLASPVAVTISVTMPDDPTADQNLGWARNSATLGLGSPGEYVIDFAAAPRRDTFYPP